MKIDTPKNPNYTATVVRLPTLVELEGCDNLVGAPIFGFQAILDKSHQKGELGIVFPAETQLSSDFCKNNNLHRHGDLNLDPGITGYLEDNRRVRAIKLRGHQSNCFFLPLSSLDYLGINHADFKEGMSFDTIDGVEICQKYQTPRKPNSGPRAQVKKFSRVNPMLFPEHIDTENYWRNVHLIPLRAHVYVTQKVHGTSWRGTRTLVKRKLTLRDRIARRLGANIDEHEWDTVAGSRKVIKDPHNPDQNHFYTEDIWTKFLSQVEDAIPEGFIVYGELIGFTPDGAAIQTNYTYHLPPGQSELVVYRVAMVNHRGVTVDLSWPQVVEFCKERAWKYVPLLWEGPHSEFVAEAWIDRRFYDDGHENALPLSGKKSLVDEGVCVRMDGMRPVILKAKSPIFLGHETALLDKGEVNLEDEGSTVEDEAEVVYA